MFVTDAGVISFDPRNKNIDYSDVREAPQHVRDTVEGVYDEALMFKESEENAILLCALLETGTR